MTMPFRPLPLHAPLPSDDRPLAGAAPSATPFAAARSALDSEALARLEELDPQGTLRLLERVFTAFEASAARLLPQLAQARAAGDPKGIRHVAHTFKSSSASIGALKLSALCVEVEAMSQSIGPGAALDERMDALCAELEIVRAALRPLPNPP